MDGQGRGGLVNSVSEYDPYERYFRPHATDALRVLGLVSVPVAYLLAGLPAFLAMLLVHGGQWGLRYFAVSRLQDWTGQMVLLLAGICSVLGLYAVVEWLDIVVHGLAVGLIVQVLGTMVGKRVDVAQTLALRFGTAMYVCRLVSAGAFLAVIWEIGEWLGFHFLDSEIGVGYDDTMGDLVAGIIGAGLGAVSALRMIRRSRQRPSWT